MPVELVFIGVNDWSNECNKIARCLNRSSKGIHARVIQQTSHPFGYTEDIVLDRGGHELAAEVLARADVICTTGDGDYPGMDAMLKALKCNKKPSAAMHVGRAYRENPEAYDLEDARRGLTHRFFCPDLYRYGKDDPKASIYLIPHDYMGVWPFTSRAGVYAVHAPSNRERKGTDEIEGAFTAATSVDPFLTYQVVWDRPAHEAWAAMEKADIFVDHLEEVHGGFGGAAYEALSYGCALVTDSHHVCPEVERFVEPVPHYPVRTRKDVVDTLLRLTRDRDELKRARIQSILWANHYLSPDWQADHWLTYLPL